MMTQAERIAAHKRIWRSRTWKRVTLRDGRRALFVKRGVGHFHVPLEELSDEEIALALPFQPLRASMVERIAQMGPAVEPEEIECQIAA